MSVPTSHTMCVRYLQGFSQQRSAESFLQDYMHAAQGNGPMHMPQPLPTTNLHLHSYSSIAPQMPPQAAATVVHQPQRVLRIETPLKTGKLVGSIVAPSNNF